jgi:hypothetical protein
MSFRRLARSATALAAVVLVLTAFTGTTGAQTGGDSRVTAGSPSTPFSQNKQNEPAIAIDPMHPNVAVAGSNDNIDMEACNAAEDNTCPFTAGVGVSGVYFSFDSAHSWTQPTYTGLSARNCLGAPGDSDPPCEPSTGPIGTLPNYDTAGLASGGDPAVAFGPAPANGSFSWSNGSRLYYANLAAAIPGESPFKGAEAVAVSHTDDIEAAAAGSNAAWSAPVIASQQNGSKFSDKEQIWADNAESSPFFGNAYVCYAAFRGNGRGGGTNQPLDVITSTDGGTTWTDRQVTSAANNIHTQNGFGRSGCTVRTDSQGVVYVFDYQFAFDPSTAAAGQIQMITSTDGGRHWSNPRNIATAFDLCNNVEPSIGRCVEDGVAGARDDLGPAPSVDIANGAPTGSDATDQIVLTWVDGRDGTNHEHVMFTSSTNAGTTWTTPAAVEQPGDRGYYSAPAISPDGSDVYLVYNAWLTPFRESTEGPENDRQLVGVVLHADVTGGAVGSFSELHRGEPGDARGSSQNNLAAEFLGDYVYAAATRTYGAAVWNDVRDAADCPAVDTYRQDLHDEAVATGQQTAEAEEPPGADEGKKPTQEEDPATAPNIQQVCPANFGNSDIFGGGYSDPTP